MSSKDNLGLPKEFNVKVLQKKIDKYHNDPFWYEGDIALIKYKGREVLVIAGGEIRISNKNGECVYSGCKERGDGFPEFKYGLDNDYQLSQLEDLGYQWDNNNWFEFLWKFEGDSNWNDIMGEVTFGYDAAIYDAMEILRDDGRWERWNEKEEKG